jgi:hypothetical protein
MISQCLAYEGNYHPSASLLTGGSLVTGSRVTQMFQKEKIRSNNSCDGNYHPSASLLTGGSLMTGSRVTQIFRKEKIRSNNSCDGNYLLLRGILSKLMSSNIL